MIEAFLHDGTVVETFTDVTIRGNVTRHLFKRPDFTVVSFDSFGQVDIISSDTRGALNELYGKCLMGQDTDYCKALY